MSSKMSNKTLKRDLSFGGLLLGITLSIVVAAAYYVKRQERKPIPIYNWKTIERTYKFDLDSMKSAPDHEKADFWFENGKYIKAMNESRIYVSKKGTKLSGVSLNDLENCLNSPQTRKKVSLKDLSKNDIIFIGITENGKKYAIQFNNLIPNQAEYNQVGLTILNFEYE